MSTVENNVCDKIKTFNWIVAPPPQKKREKIKICMWICYKFYEIFNMYEL